MAVKHGGHEGQSQAHTFDFRVALLMQPLKRLEQERLVFGVDAKPCIVDRHGPGSRAFLHGASHLGARRAIFQGIVQDVRQCAAHKHRVGMSDGRFGAILCDGHVYLAFTGQGPGFVHNTFQQDSEVHFFKRVFLRLGMGEVDKTFCQRQG